MNQWKRSIKIELLACEGDITLRQKYYSAHRILRSCSLIHYPPTKAPQVSHYVLLCSVMMTLGVEEFLLFHRGQMSDCPWLGNVK